MKALLLLVCVWLPMVVGAEEVYQTPEDFLQQAFFGTPPKAKTLWLTKDIKPQIKKIMEHDYPVLRTKYWRQGERTAWILEEIGKVKPITVGFVVDQDQIEFVSVLIYRETHGWEVRYPFFTDQFKQVTLVGDNKLSRPIDNISGATMSVDALRNLTKLALFLHVQVQNED